MTDKERKFSTYFMKVALLTAELSHARRHKVGSVLVKDRRIVCCGYNGRLSGEDNNCEYENPDGTLTTRPDVVHAEGNILSYAAKYELETDGADLYCTLSPCYNCSLLLIQAGIKRVIFYEKYRDEAPIKLLIDHGVEVIWFPESEWTNNDIEIVKQI